MSLFILWPSDWPRRAAALLRPAFDEVALSSRIAAAVDHEPAVVAKLQLVPSLADNIVESRELLEHNHSKLRDRLKHIAPIVDT
jgi:hypothetical protein